MSIPLRIFSKHQRASKKPEVCISSVWHVPVFFAAHHKGLHFDGDLHAVKDKNSDVFLIFRCLKFLSEHVFLGDQN